MTTVTRLIGAAVATLVLALPAFAGPTVADAQLLATGADSWVVRIRSSDAQAFDVTENGTPFVVRLHGARVDPSRAPLEPAPFGSVTLMQQQGGVDVRVTVAEGFVVSVTQGPSADTVDVRIAAAAR